MADELTKKQQDFIDRFADDYGLNVKRTCEAIGIHRSTYYEWLGDADKPNAFRIAVDDCAEGMKDDVEQAMYSKMIDEGNVPLMIHFSKTKMRERGYGDHTTTKQSHEFESSFMKELSSGLVSVYLPDNGRDKEDTSDTID